MERENEPFMPAIHDPSRLRKRLLRLGEDEIERPAGSAERRFLSAGLRDRVRAGIQGCRAGITEGYKGKDVLSLSKNKTTIAVQIVQMKRHAVRSNLRQCYL